MYDEIARKYRTLFLALRFPRNTDRFIKTQAIEPPLVFQFNRFLDALHGPAQRHSLRQAPPAMPGDCFTQILPRLRKACV